MVSTLQLVSVGASALLYYGFFNLNTLLFSSLELHQGANWVFLPAGLRLLCTLLLGGEGAIGLLLASYVLALSMTNFDPITTIVTPLISAGAPYLIYRLALARGLPVTLENLTAASLGVLILLYAITSSLLHSVWFAISGVSQSFLSSFTAMLIGDLIGTIIIIYMIKIVLTVWDRMKKRD